MEYAVYKDDRFICMGTLKEIADYLEVSYETVRLYKKKGTYIFIQVGRKRRQWI